MSAFIGMARTTCTAIGCVAAALAMASLPACAGAGAPLTPSRAGDAWGTNIHWTAAPGGEAEVGMLSKAYRVVRMDFKWGVIEKQSKGVYDFAAYDTLLATMQRHGLRPYWILDYGNVLYPPQPVPGEDCSTPARCNATCPRINKQPMRTCSADGSYYCCGAPGCRGTHVCPTNPSVLSCYCDGKVHGSPGCNTDECIAAFAAFAAAAVDRYKGRGIVFECLNEPNGMGHDSAADIAALCKAAGAAFRAAGEVFVGPATSAFDWNYLNVSMASGILGALSAVSVHPYRGTSPETVVPDWATLRAMVAAHGTTAAQRSLPVVSGEWQVVTKVLRVAAAMCVRTCA